MTNNNNQFKPIIKKEPFIPKTETRIFLGGQPVEQSQTKQSNLSITAQNKVVNRSITYQSPRMYDTDSGYGPCENYSCPHSTSFILSIDIEGERYWGRKPAEFVNSWNNWVWNSSYCWSSTLTLHDISQARDAL